MNYPKSYNVPFISMISYSAANALGKRCIHKPVKHLRWSFFPKIVNGLQPFLIVRDFA